ncbi:two-component response regulator ARR2-like [Euphorbia lathyris]|uniref:two-component response regulator ARR2-like n=1 Tax=Euphorbia lathyris TaxID=212925 RepID=UPI003313A9B1
MTAESGATGVRVLVVDCDSTCLAVVSHMLYAHGYRVITATNVGDAMRILRERKYELDLILTEFYLPDMDKYELFETMGKISSLPIVILSADDDENAMLGCLLKGAALYLVKPITMNDVKILWQFSIKKQKEKENIDSERSSTSCENGSAPENSSSNDDVLESDRYSSSLSKKSKLIWTNELHFKFLEAIKILGIDDAHPREILQHMNVPGLNNEHISSYLQKYRRTLRREQDAIERRMLGGDHQMSSFNFHGETFNVPEFIGSSSSQQQEQLFLLPPPPPPGSPPRMWEQQRNGIFDAEIGDFEQKFHMSIGCEELNFSHG